LIALKKDGAQADCLYVSVCVFQKQTKTRKRVGGRGDHVLKSLPREGRWNDP
jgi:hypothetical protein